MTFQYDFHFFVVKKKMLAYSAIFVTYKYTNVSINPWLASYNTF